MFVEATAIFAEYTYKPVYQRSGSALCGLACLATLLRTSMDDVVAIMSHATHTYHLFSTCKPDGMPYIEHAVNIMPEMFDTVEDGHQLAGEPCINDRALLTVIHMMDCRLCGPFSIDVENLELCMANLSNLWGDGKVRTLQDIRDRPTSNDLKIGLPLFTFPAIVTVISRNYKDTLHYIVYDPYRKGVNPFLDPARESDLPNESFDYVDYEIVEWCPIRPLSFCKGSV